MVSVCVIILLKEPVTLVIQYSTVQYSTVPYRTVPYSTVQFCTVHCYTLSKLKLELLRVCVPLPESKAEAVVLQFQFQIISDFKMTTKAKTLVTEGKTLVVTKGKPLVIKGKSNHAFAKKKVRAKPHSSPQGLELKGP